VIRHANSNSDHNTSENHSVSIIKGDETKLGVPPMTMNCHGKLYQKILSHSVTVINFKSQIIIKSSLLRHGYDTALSP